MLDIKGKRFGRLLVSEKVDVPGARNAMWRCQCDCGNTTVAAAANIGRTTFSCGCLAKETAAELLRRNNYKRTHSGCGTPEYRSWHHMKNRCYNKNNKKYPLYGARGIAVYEPWRTSFENFIADMGPKPSNRHSVNRIDNDGDYTPDNCHWATPLQQARNTSRNVFVTINGETRCVSAWCEFLGVKIAKVYGMFGVRKGYKQPFDSAEAVIRHLYRTQSR